MRKIAQQDKTRKKKPSREKQEASYRLGQSLDDPISPASVMCHIHNETPICETTYGKLVDGIEIPYFDPVHPGHIETDNDFYQWFKALNEHKVKSQPIRTTKELAVYLIEKAENILPESKQRKVLFKKERAARKGETLEERIDREKKIKRRDLNKKIRIKATKQRRKEFNLKKPQLILKMLAEDMIYECCIDGCENKNITIDHIIPLSLGGTDDIENLQFLCGNHNSQKGIKSE